MASLSRVSCRFLSRFLASSSKSSIKRTLSCVFWEFLAESGAFLAGHFVLLYNFSGSRFLGAWHVGGLDCKFFLKVVLSAPADSSHIWGHGDTHPISVRALASSRARNLLASVVLFIPGLLRVLVIFILSLVAHEFSLAPSSPVSGCGF